MKKSNNLDYLLFIYMKVYVNLLAYLFNDMCIN